MVAGPGEPRGASPEEPWFIERCKTAPFDFAHDEKMATLSTQALRVLFNLNDGRLTFQDAGGTTLHSESDREPRRYDRVEVNGEKLYRVSERLSLDAHQALYGLGQHQSGVFNYRGTVVELAQANADISLPLLISSNGSAILWNTASRSQFDDRFPPELKLTADAADAIDYYFLYGPEMDSLIHQYRDLTGHAPLFGKWAYDSSNQRIVTSPPKNCWMSRPNIARSTCLLTLSCRIGFGGSARAIRSIRKST